MQQDVLVLCYHGISDSWPAETTVRPAAFEAQLTAFARAGYRGATITEALTLPPHQKTLAITFDDAHRSVLALAAPIMERLGMVGTIYVPTDYAGTDQPMGWDGYDMWLNTAHEPELLCLGWDDLRGLAARGWEIGSHTCSHPHLASLADESEIACELTESKSICEDRMQAECASLAYPYSDFDARSVAAAAAAGYRSATTVPRVSTAALPLMWPRVGVSRGDDARGVRLRAWSRKLGPAFPAQAALRLKKLLR